LKVALLSTAAILSLTLALPAAAATNTMNHVNNAMSAHSMTINLGAQNGSKQDGQAFLNDTPAGLRVKVQVKNEPAGAVEPAHIHQGTCANLNPAPWKGLSNVVGGVSVTTISGLTLAALKKAHYAINVHQSAAHLTHYVACGDL
jgi:Cu/Zn superoxide dismutase